MYIIAGLGNPTREYEKTRHNVGFDTIDVLADKLNTSVDEKFLMTRRPPRSTLFPTRRSSDLGI